MAPSVAEQVAVLHRRHYRELLAPLIRILGSFERAEDMVQEAFGQALLRWTEQGVPDHPLAWLRRVAKNRALDVYRRDGRWRQIASALEREYAEQETTSLEDATAQAAGDPRAADLDTLRLVFTCCHPSLAPEARIALTLRTVCGLSSEQVARAFLIPKTTLQQRIVRARRKIDRAKIPYEVPDREQLPHRLSGVLHTIYLVFNEGHGALGGAAEMGRDLAEEAVRLVRLVCDLLPDAGAPRAMLALLLLHHARRHARLDDSGELVLLEDQDRSRWDRAAIEEALPLVDAALRERPIPPYAVEAAIAALHARAQRAQDTDWPQIAALYALLERRAPGNPVIALNALVARAMAGDLEAQAQRLQGMEQEPKLRNYAPYWAARGELALRRGRLEEAAEAFGRAAGLSTEATERRHLDRRRSLAQRARAAKEKKI